MLGVIFNLHIIIIEKDLMLRQVSYLYDAIVQNVVPSLAKLLQD